jgi:hypothetical protein
MVKEISSHMSIIDEHRIRIRSWEWARLVPLKVSLCGSIVHEHDWQERRVRLASCRFSCVH